MRNNILYEKPIINGSGCIAVIDDCFKDTPLPLPDCPRIFIHADEREKSLDTVSRIFSMLVGLEADRSTFLIGVGGGITTDITGFVAATYKRGLKFGLVPTTLLAQVDAAFGGKNGVNFSGFKNVIGTFHEPEWVYVDPSFLDTLPHRILMCGAAEMLKTFIIADRDAYFKAVALFTSGCRDKEVLGGLVRRAIEIKCDIVEKDPLDLGTRHLLNLGHTFGHAIEKYDRTMMHGEAVAAGTVMAARMSVRQGMMQESEMNRIISDFSAMGLPVETSVDMALLKEAILQDKKRSGDKISFVLPLKIGEATIWETSVTA